MTQNAQRAFQLRISGAFRWAIAARTATQARAQSAQHFTQSLTLSLTARNKPTGDREDQGNFGRFWAIRTTQERNVNEIELDPFRC